MNSRTHIKLGSMQSQMDLLKLLQTRHDTWLTEKTSLQITQIHAEIIQLLGKTIKKYEMLLELYNYQNE
jgi:hypothetical protein